MSPSIEAMPGYPQIIGSYKTVPSLHKAHAVHSLLRPHRSWLSLAIGHGITHTARCIYVVAADTTVVPNIEAELLLFVLRKQKILVSGLATQCCPRNDNLCRVQKFELSSVSFDLARDI